MQVEAPKGHVETIVRNGKGVFWMYETANDLGAYTVTTSRSHRIIVVTSPLTLDVLQRLRKLAAVHNPTEGKFDRLGDICHATQKRAGHMFAAVVVADATSALLPNNTDFAAHTLENQQRLEALSDALESINAKFLYVDTRSTTDTSSEWMDAGVRDIHFLESLNIVCRVVYGRSVRHHARLCACILPGVDTVRSLDLPTRLWDGYFDTPCMDFAARLAGKLNRQAFATKLFPFMLLHSQADPERLRALEVTSGGLLSTTILSRRVILRSMMREAAHELFHSCMGAPLLAPGREPRHLHSVFERCTGVILMSGCTLPDRVVLDSVQVLSMRAGMKKSPNYTKGTERACCELVAVVTSPNFSRRNLKAYPLFSHTHCRDSMILSYLMAIKRMFSGQGWCGTQILAPSRDTMFCRLSDMMTTLEIPFRGHERWVTNELALLEQSHYDYDNSETTFQCRDMALVQHEWPCRSMSRVMVEVLSSSHYHDKPVAFRRLVSFEPQGSHAKRKRMSKEEESLIDEARWIKSVSVLFRAELRLNKRRRICQKVVRDPCHGYPIKKLIC